MGVMKDILYGCAIGDALGVPYEFKTRGSFFCTDMTGYGTHSQPKGTWSDDTSMTLCLADSMVKDFSLEKLASNFLDWYENAAFTANGSLFDIGNATASALRKIRNGVNCTEAGGNDEWSNGNGSLMRIAPLVLLTKNMPIEKRFLICRQVSSITHRHQISIAACFIYLELLRSLLSGDSLQKALSAAVDTKNILPTFGIENSVVSKFDILNKNLKEYSESNISSSGYVIDTLVSSIWCVSNTSTYRSAVLKAVNLGDDTDTTGAVTGVIAGIVYGYENIPKNWIYSLLNKQLIESIIKKFDECDGYK